MGAKLGRNVLHPGGRCRRSQHGHSTVLPLKMARKHTVMAAEIAQSLVRAVQTSAPF